MLNNSKACFFFFTLLSTNLPAYGGNCNSTDCPSTWATSNCNNICSITGPLTFECNLDQGMLATTGGTFYAVTDWDGGGEDDFSFFGYDGQGNKFGCYFDFTSAPHHGFTFYGTFLSDTMNMYYFTTELTNPYSAGSGIGVSVHGEGSGDEIRGSSDTNSNNYQETLSGNNGADEIHGRAGEDVIYGGDGEDDLYGDDGEDEIYGNDNSDYIEGGADADVIEGGPGNDDVYGDGGNDVLNGNSGSDLLCGGQSAGPGRDSYNGGLGNDYMYSPSSANKPTGIDAAGTNCCGQSSHGSFLTSGGCTYTMTSCARTCL